MHFLIYFSFPSSTAILITFAIRLLFGFCFSPTDTPTSQRIIIPWGVVGKVFPTRITLTLLDITETSSMRFLDGASFQRG